MYVLLLIPVNAAVMNLAGPTVLTTLAPAAEPPTGNDNNDDDWELDNPTRCWLEGYQYVSCHPLMVPHNLCPYNNSIFEKCICDPNLVSCTKPYYGVGEDCDGKYISCELDNSKACQEEGYTQSGECPSFAGNQSKMSLRSNLL